MKSYTIDLTPEHIAFIKKQFYACSLSSREAQSIGQQRVLEVANKEGNLRFLPVTFDGRHNDENLENIVAILRYNPDCKFSADRKVVELVKKGYKEVGMSWQNLSNAPISTSLPEYLFSIKRDVVNQAAINHPDICWVSRSPTGKIWDLKVIGESIEWKGDKPYDMIFVNQDLSHPDKHFETYNDRGVYLGKMDKDTMLLYAESIPYEKRVAIPKSAA